MKTGYQVAQIKRRVRADERSKVIDEVLEVIDDIFERLEDSTLEYVDLWYEEARDRIQALKGGEQE